MKTLAPKLTHTSVSTFLDTVSRESHAMAGAVIAANAANAASLGRACVRITCEALQGEQRHTVEQVGQELDHIRHALRDWIDQDAEAIAQVVLLRTRGQEEQALTPLFEGAAEIADLALDACGHLQEFRGTVSPRVRDDLEFAIALLASAARTAVTLLESNLRAWPHEPYGSRFRPLAEGLNERLSELDT